MTIRILPVFLATLLVAAEAAAQPAPVATATQSVTGPWRRLPALEGGEVKGVVSLGNDLFAVANARVFRSKDNGASWATSDEGVAWASSHIAVMGKDLYVGGSKGVYRSSDKGRRWTHLPFDPAFGRSCAVMDFAGGKKALLAATLCGPLHWNGKAWRKLQEGVPKVSTAAITTDGDTLYFATSGKLFRAGVKDASWTEVSALPNMRQPSSLHVAGKTLIAIDDRSLVRSKDGGVTWEPLTSPGTSFRPRLMLAGKDLLTWAKDGIYASRDLGTSWTLVGTGMPTIDHMKYQLASAGRALVLATSQGVFRLPRPGATWTASNKGLAAQTVTSIAKKGDAVLVGTRGPVFRCTASTCEPTGASSTIVWVSSTGRVFAGIAYSDDGGVTWSNGTGWKTGGTIAGYAEQGGMIFMADNEHGVWESKDSGKSWALMAAWPFKGFFSGARSLVQTKGQLFAGRLGTAKTPTLVVQGRPGSAWEPTGGLPLQTTMVEVLRAEGDHLFVVLESNNIHRMTWQDGRWSAVEEIKTGLPADLDGKVQDLAASGSTAWLAASSALLTSTDAGATWTPVTPALPARGGHTLLFHEGTLYVGHAHDGIWSAPVGAATTK